ncbi:hypothetical protein ACTFO8_29115 [Bacillus cereus group sp. MYBK65-1]|uniref:hypothetical protein n=1 Tax=Bacillus cereus group TaxID=86661 RepID=UPI001FF2D7E5|nr:hypothetical protein [Bacillus cereus]MDA2440698.1 hypothetical protein [Bacillus cereus]MDA2446671.1 hypothetical protein [Bacillus cereus]MDA2519987.1 hypothetical protein [Bacillus cereus]MEB8692614.1 hypothetical protein [Bacillus cereus]UOX99367.1 hypothetical protein MWG54_30845 [Bacillus cereus]
MKITEHFNLNLTQEQLEFVNVDTERDARLFIDPCWIHIKEGNWFREASATLYGFFDHIISLYEENRREEARELFNCAHEPNETCFGLSRNNPRGTGASEEMLAEVFDYIVSQQMIEAGLIKRLEDLHVFIDKFGPDRLSDLVTNVIRKHLVQFTKEQCELHGIPLGNERIDIGPYWNNESKTWEICNDFPLLANDKLILLVPKDITVKVYRYSPGQYCTHYVLVKRQVEHKEQDTHLVTRIPRKDNTFRVEVFKRDIIQEEIKDAGKNQKQYVREITVENVDLIEQFREGIINTLTSPTRTNKLSDEMLTDVIRRAAN